MKYYQMGWLSPRGKFYDCFPYSDNYVYHLELALNILKDKWGVSNEIVYSKIGDKGFTDPSMYLESIKYLKLHIRCGEPSWELPEISRSTFSQRRFIFNWRLAREEYYKK